MSDSTNAILQNAFDLIEQGELEQAQTVLAPLLETENDNPDLWWVYAHAVRDSETGIQALDRVIQLDAAYPGASELKRQADVAPFSNGAAISEADAASAPPADEEQGDVDDWEDLQPAVERAGQDRRIGRGFAVAIAAFLLIALGALLVLSGEVDISPLTALIAPSPPPQIAVVSVSTETTDSSTPAPTEIDESPTTAPTATEVPATASPETAAFIAMVADAISDLEINETVSGFRRTELGNTLVFYVCAVPGPQFQARLGSVMNAVASLDASIPENAEAIAVSLLNCADEDATPRAVGVERDIIQSYANEEIDARDFQRSWTALP